jgi:hypothetical protein
MHSFEQGCQIVYLDAKNASYGVHFCYQDNTGNSGCEVEYFQLKRMYVVMKHILTSKTQFHLVIMKNTVS